MLQERLARLRNQLHGLLQIPGDQTINDLDVVGESRKIFGVLLVPPDQLCDFSSSDTTSPLAASTCDASRVACCADKLFARI